MDHNHHEHNHELDIQEQIAMQRFQREIGAASKVLDDHGYRPLQPVQAGEGEFILYGVKFDLEAENPAVEIGYAHNDHIHAAGIGLVVDGTLEEDGLPRFVLTGTEALAQVAAVDASRLVLELEFAQKMAMELTIVLHGVSQGALPKEALSSSWDPPEVAPTSGLILPT